MANDTPFISDFNNAPTIAVSSTLISPSGEKPLTPAMCAILWEIAAVLDEKKIPETVENAVWLNIPAARLKGEGANESHRWLRECLERLLEVKISGEYRGDRWGAVMLAEYHLPYRGDMVRVLIPPTAVKMVRSSQTFAKIERWAVHRLPGPAQRLYAALADRKRQTKRKDHKYTLDELRHLFGVPGKYQRWGRLYDGLLKPALAGIAKFGTVDVTMTKIKEGRRVVGVNLAWQWKDVRAAEVVAKETTRSRPFAEIPAKPSAPPLISETLADRHANMAQWWGDLSGPEQDAIQACASEEATETEILIAAYDSAHRDEMRFCEVVWDTVKDTLAERLGVDVYTSWMAPIKIETIEKDIATLHVPSGFFANHIKTNYTDAILTSFAALDINVQNLRFTFPR